jgi:sterol desaturase/sphingolipid hydroxylase (fatty acid hydroxylase superfamily)
MNELDRLIEENENLRRNKKWQRKDKMFKLSMLLMLLAFPFMFLTLLICGPQIATICVTIYFLILCFLAFFEMFIDLREDFFKDSYKNIDMTKKYYRK